MDTTFSPQQIMGEFRASLDGIKRNEAHLVWMCWSYLLLSEEHRHSARHQLQRLFEKERYHGAELVEWLDWVGQGFKGLVKMLEKEGQREPRHEIEHPERCAAFFLSAWLWQCALRRHDRYAEADLYVTLGLGQERALVMEWDFRTRPMGRHITFAHSSLEQGQLNTHAALSGFPGLPEHCHWPVSS